MSQLLALLLLLLLPPALAGWLFGGTTGVLVALLLALALAGSAWLVSRRVVLRVFDATPVAVDTQPELVAQVERLAARAGIAKPLVAVSRLGTPNAFAAVTPGGGVVGVTEGLLLLLSDRELEAVLAHEVAHLMRRGHAAATLATVCAALPGWLSTASGAELYYERHYRRGAQRAWGGGRLRPLRDGLAIVAVPLIAVLVRVSVARRAELEADARAVTLTGDADALARALRRIDALAGRVLAPVNPAAAHLLVVHPYGAQAVGRVFDAHPPLDERLAALDVLAAAAGR